MNGVSRSPSGDKARAFVDLGQSSVTGPELCAYGRGRSANNRIGDSQPIYGTGGGCRDRYLLADIDYLMQFLSEAFVDGQPNALLYRMWQNFSQCQS